MFGLSAAVRVYRAKEPADMRKRFDGLSALVAGPLALDPLSGHRFVFLNKRRDRIKILYWDRDGLAVWAKRLERGTFRVPQVTAGRIEMTTAALAALLAGIDLNTARRRRRYTRPLTPLKNSEDFAPTKEHASTYYGV
jgi:transposase